MIVVAGDVARRRRERGLKLNHPEAVALITAELLEGARDGRTVADLMSFGTTILTEEDVMEGVASMVDSIQLEATFPDGTKLVTVHHPIRPAGDDDGAAAGSGRDQQGQDSRDQQSQDQRGQEQHAKEAGAQKAAGTPDRRELGLPGEVIIDDEPIILNEGRETVTVTVKNVGDRPVQVGSHYHFAETNPALQFDREKAVGFRLDIPAGTSARFEPGDAKEVSLVAYGGNRTVFGFHNDWDGPLDKVHPPTPDGIPDVHFDHKPGEK